MLIEEAQIHKRHLEHAIRQLVETFEDKTGLEVSMVYAQPGRKGHADRVEVVAQLRSNIPPPSVDVSVLPANVQKKIVERRELREQHEAALKEVA